MLAGETGAPDDARRRGASRARGHLLFAQSCGRPALASPALICVGGVMGSGKSTVAEALALRLGCAVVDADRTRKDLLGVGESTRLDHAAWSGAYDAATSERTYGELLRRAAVVLASGRSVIVDASFRARAARAHARAVAEAAGAIFRFVECRAPLDVCRARVARRPRGASDGRPAVFDEFAASFEAPSELAASERIVIDTTGAPEVVVDGLRGRLPAAPHELASPASAV
jgi:predicted kinase